MTTNENEARPGDYLQEWEDVARYQVAIRVGYDDFAVGPKHDTWIDAEADEREVQRLVDAEDWGALTRRVLDHEGRAYPFSDDDAPTPLRIRESEEGLLTGYAYEEVKAALHARGLDIETDDRGMRVVARYDSARTRALMSEALTAGVTNSSRRAARRRTVRRTRSMRCGSPSTMRARAWFARESREARPWLAPTSRGSCGWRLARAGA